MKRIGVAIAVAALSCFVGCSHGASGQGEGLLSSPVSSDAAQVEDGGHRSNSPDAEKPVASDDVPAKSSAVKSAQSPSASASSQATSWQAVQMTCRELADKIGIVEDIDEHPDFNHGKKGAKYQKYIVLHDTEGGGEPEDVVAGWENSDRRVAAHFVVGKDGRIVQCVDLEAIGHHAGYGDTGHNELFGVEDESRDDKVGASPIGDWAADYGMNSYSIGIEMIHMAEEADYPEAQLKAVDAVVAYIDAYFADNPKKSEIITHKDWRSGNSDTSEVFDASYLDNYQGKMRTHDGKPFDIESLESESD